MTPEMSTNMLSLTATIVEFIPLILYQDWTSCCRWSILSLSIKLVPTSSNLSPLTSAQNCTKHTYLSCRHSLRRSSNVTIAWWSTFSTCAYESPDCVRCWYQWHCRAVNSQDMMLMVLTLMLCPTKYDHRNVATTVWLCLDTFGWHVPSDSVVVLWWISVWFWHLMMWMIVNNVKNPSQTVDDTRQISSNSS